MMPLYHETHFTFRFADDRIIPRFHLEGIESGQRVRVFNIDAETERGSALIAMAIVGEEGWVDLDNADHCPSRTWVRGRARSNNL